MDTKEQIIGKVITFLSDQLSPDALNMIKNIMSACLNEYDLSPKKNLPTTEVVDNEKIIRHYFATKKMEGLSGYTLKTYNFHIQKFFDFSHLPVGDVTTNAVRYYLAELGVKGSPAFVDDARRVLNTFFEFCVDEEYILKNPVKRIKRVKIPKTMERPYSDVEVEMLRDACDNYRDRALIDFLFSTGCRREEITKIKISDIDFINRSVLIHGKGSKDRMVYFSAKCEKHMLEYINNRKYTSEYLFCSRRNNHGKLSNEGLNAIVKKIGEKAGVPNVHLHRFRKWFATYMANQGVPLQDLKEMMGHSKLDTTNNYYVYTNEERIKMNHRNHAA